MKCTACGNNKLYEISIIDNQVVRTEGYVAQTVNSYACENCGHVELYVDNNF
jgi:predicted nucleic-acid-binding Zn-ribbon protein